MRSTYRKRRIYESDNRVTLNSVSGQARSILTTLNRLASDTADPEIKNLQEVFTNFYWDLDELLTDMSKLMELQSKVYDLVRYVERTQGV